MNFLDAYLPSYDDFRRFEPTRAPLQPISGPCSIEKYPSSRMASRYNRIFDAGGSESENFMLLLPLAQPNIGFPSRDQAGC